MSAFSLPWYAAVGANKALEAGLPYMACILIGVVGPTAGRFLIDITSGVTPQHFVRGEWFVGTAVLTIVVYIIADAGLGLTIWPATLLAFAVGLPVPCPRPTAALGGAAATGPGRCGRAQFMTRDRSHTITTEEADPWRHRSRARSSSMSATRRRTGRRTRPPKAPKDAPNVLIVLYDDTGLAAWSPFGGRINMPTLQKLADDGLMYSQWHTTALCSPTRSTFLTGRNHHQNGMACITEGSIGYPGANAHIPPECGTLAEVMRQAGWSTFWLGKNHNVPVDDLAAGGTKETWPLHQGWDRFYGFLGGETNKWYPDLVNDNHYIDAAATRRRRATTSPRIWPTRRSR